MHRRGSTLDSSPPEDQLAWLLLRVIAQLSPCTEGTLVAHVACGEDGSASVARLQGRLGNALRKLGELAFIRLAGEHIIITEEGLRVLDRRQIAAAPGRQDPGAEASRPGGGTVEDIGHALSAALRQMSEAIAATKKMAETEEAPGKEMRPAATGEYPWSPLRPDAGMQVLTVNGDIAIACRGVGTIDGLAEGEEMASGASNHFMPDARHSERPWGRPIGSLRTHAVALQAWMRPVVAIVGAGAMALPPWLMRLATICRTRTMAVGGWGRRVGAKLRTLLLRPQFAGFERAPLLIVGCALLGVLAIAGGAALFSRGEATRASRFPIVWQLDQPDRPIFVTHTTGKEVWVKGISIRGENLSNETLTAVQAVLKPDRSNAEIRLDVSLAGDGGTQEIPAGAAFALNYAFPQAAAPGQQGGISAEDFLSTYGGLIFAFHYTQSGQETTRIEYLSPSMLRAQLAEIEGPASR